MGLLASDSDEQEIKLKDPNLQLSYTRQEVSAYTINSFMFVTLCGFPLHNCPECVADNKKAGYYSQTNIQLCVEG